MLLLLLTKKTRSVSNLVQKTDYSRKVTEIKKKITDHNHHKYINIPELNKFASEILDLRLKQGKLASKSDIASFAKKSDFNNN